MARPRASPSIAAAAPAHDSLVHLPRPATRAPAPSPSKVPHAIRFPLVLVLSLALSSLLYSLVADFTGGELAQVARKLRGRGEEGQGDGELEEWSALGLAVGWRGLELGLGWFAGYDGYDLTALTLLAHGPPLYLLSAFYNVHATTIFSSLFIDTLATSIPFRLLRPLSLAHTATSSSSIPIPNKDIVTDIPIQVYTTILSAAIYSVTLALAYATYLPVSLVTYFADLPSIEAAHTATLVSLFPFTITLGLAVKTFIFTPAVAVQQTQPAFFDPETASLWETVLYNFWGWSGRTKVVIKRTAALMFITGVNTFVQCWVTLEGVEARGALAYAGVWTLAAGLAGTAVGLAGAI